MMTSILLLAFCLQDEKAVDDALDLFKNAIKAPTEAERATAVAELSRIKHARTLARLTPFLSSDGTTVRMAAAKGLGEFADLRKAAAAALLGALPANAKQPDVQTALLEAAGLLRESSALGGLHRAFDEKDVRPAKAAVIAAALQKSPTSMDPLLELLKKLDRAMRDDTGAAVTAGNVNGYDVTARDDGERKRALELRPVVIKALADVCGETFANAVEGQAWWARHRAAFKPK